MPPPISDEKLTIWAREHLVYEGVMLAHTARRVAELVHAPRDAESNMVVECFAIHVRCLDDFLWASRGDRHELDAFAADFCAPGVWERERGKRPPALIEVRTRSRTGREIVHLSYHRLDVPAATKDWPVGEIAKGIIDALDVLAAHALPERLDDRTRAALRSLSTPTHVSASPSTATHVGYTGGTVPFQNWS
jgi:hypothetical protein